MQGCVRLITYSLPDLESIRRVLSKRPENIFIIANPRAANAESRAEEIKEEFPNIRIALNSETHSKVVLIEPDSLMVSSANFGKSGWHETTVSFHQKEAHDYYVENEFEPLWNISDEVFAEKEGGQLFSLNTSGTMERLHLENTAITDAGLVHLKGLKDLKELSLINTAITDAGLVHLKGLTKLEDLWLDYTDVTVAGVHELQEALPYCGIYAFKHDAEALKAQAELSSA